MKKISINAKNCMTCKSCEVHCAVAHSASKNLHAAISAVPASTSRVRVRATKTANTSPNAYFAVADSAFKSLYDPVTGRSSPQLHNGRKPAKTVKMEIAQCRNCEDSECVSSCEHNAITKDDKTGLTVVDDNHCMRCDSTACMTACPFGAIGVDTAANTITSLPRIRIKPTKKTKVEITQCKHCRNPRCVDSCEHNAITKDGKTGLTTIDRNYCKKCMSMACLAACPFEAIVMERANNTILVCDQCHETGIPACVSACPGSVFQIN